YYDEDDNTATSPVKEKAAAAARKAAGAFAGIAAAVSARRAAASDKSTGDRAAASAGKTAAGASSRAAGSDPKIKVIGDPDEYMDYPPETPKKTAKNAIIIAVVAVAACLILFAAASYTGIIKTFLTPDKRVVKEAAGPETSSQETTTASETTTPETTTAETTTEYTPLPYSIIVNLAYNQVIVYERGEKYNDGVDPKDPEDDEYAWTPIYVFTCSPGVSGATPVGTYKISDRSNWCLMIGDVYTQYATRVTEDIMFHSVPYYTMDPGDLETQEYNILGYDASSGCIRLNCADASWIFFNCEEGTEVEIGYYADLYSPVMPNPTYHVPEDIPELAKWDPTDTYNAGNPWMSYTAKLTQESVTIPCGSSVDYLIAAVGPTDEYGNSLHNYFYTAGGYDLWTPGTYNTTAFIDIGNLSFQFPLTITVTEELSDDYYINLYGYDPYDDGTGNNDNNGGDDNASNNNGNGYSYYYDVDGDGIDDYIVDLDGDGYADSIEYGTANAGNDYT
ncbi:MAG: L,D-transpeptidase, partial [Parasporobacterium sp.]|nr:L,D-transpeptidase [Parasporobacterium sp.]